MVSSRVIYCELQRAVLNGLVGMVPQHQCRALVLSLMRDRNKLMTASCHLYRLLDLLIVLLAQLISKLVMRVFIRP